MAGIFRIIVVGISFVMLCGCASTKTYFSDRGRDALDILTVSVGNGGGVQGRIGPFSVGTVYAEDVAGLRCGKCGLFPKIELPREDPKPAAVSYDFSFVGFLCVAFSRGMAPASELVMNDYFQIEDGRGKAYTAKGGPFFSWVIGSEEECHPDRLFHPYYTQMELLGGFVYTARAGINAGELVDFLLGWVGIDFFDDDNIGSVQGKK
jgi:hypothetical protein